MVMKRLDKIQDLNQLSDFMGQDASKVIINHKGELSRQLQDLLEA